MSSDESPEYSPFFGVMGASAAMVFSGKYPQLLHLTFQPLALLCRVGRVSLAQRWIPVTAFEWGTLSCLKGVSVG